jgi:tRNASer (uridine44-2'-O)-methyltransferase
VLHDDSRHHNGIFPQGTFILSNHADELTTWTPLLAYQNKSPFIAIPCCSHNLAGTRIRFNDREAPFADPAIPVPETEIRKTKNPLSAARLKENILAMKREPAPTSSGNAVLAPRTSEKQNGLKPPSAYQSLTFYTARLATECGFLAEKEMLRIPSTRNAAIVGRDSKSENDEDDEERREKVGRIVRREVGDLKVVAKEWMERAMVIAGAKGGAGGH